MKLQPFRFMDFILSSSLLFAGLFLPAKSHAQDKFETYPVYQGTDLGVHYAPSKTSFRVWAPNASEVLLRLYKAGDGGEPTKTVKLKKAEHGTWTAQEKGNLKNIYYTFQVKQDDKWLLEKPDIYAKAVGVNGKRGMIVDLAATNPKDWNNDKKPAQKNFTDIIVYELHMRDISVHPQSGIKHKGKFLGLAETGTKTPDGLTTGLDHIKEVGATHVHLLPSFDFSTIDETKLDKNQYNWGYDPQNYNVPEGSYSTNPFDGNVRIREFKQMVKALHDNGLRVVLDVVYNHTHQTDDSNFNQFAPFYYYRQNAQGAYSNASACGNETASERPMMRKFIVESVLYWAKEYHIDAFRFDLMGIHDIETMNAVTDALQKVDPTIFVYGEGWAVGSSPVAEELRAVKKNVPQLKQVAAFNDDTRDGMKGPFHDAKQNGFVSGAKGLEESIKFGIVAATKHPQVDYKKVNYSNAPWAPQPSQCINYVSCHDDHTLFDRLHESNHGVDEKELIKMDKLSNTIVLTSQGVSFIHNGAEMLRTKFGEGNSYKSPDSINQIDYNRKKQYPEVYSYYRSLIALRKNHPAFRMPTTEMIQKHLRFLDTNEPNVIAYTISGNANGDAWKNILVLINGNRKDKTYTLPEGKWTLVGDGNKIDEKGISKVSSSSIALPGTTALILFGE